MAQNELQNSNKRNGTSFRKKDSDSGIWEQFVNSGASSSEEWEKIYVNKQKMSCRNRI